MELCEEYDYHFRLRIREAFAQPRQYLSESVQARKKNMERMAEVVPESDEQALPHLLSDSNWDERVVLGQVALEADALLVGTGGSASSIGESGSTKRVNKPVNVARQWKGRLCKVDNRQLGVYAALSRGSLSTFIDTRLYLPSSSVQDKGRCRGRGAE